MDWTIRQATAADAEGWLDLIHASLGADYPDREVYETGWVQGQIDPAHGHETWVAAAAGRLEASTSFLQPGAQARNPVLNLGRQLFRPGSFDNGAAEALLRHIVDLARDRNQMLVGRVLGTEIDQQRLLEKLGFVCAGFQPAKHQFRTRHGVLFYVRFARPDMVPRLPVSESLPHVSELATMILRSVGLPEPGLVRDGATGYPLQTDVDLAEIPYTDFALWRLRAHSADPPTEISSGYNLGCGFLRSAGNTQLHAVVGRRDQEVVSGLAYLIDPTDRCVRLVDSFHTDDLSMGALLAHVARRAQEEFRSLYLEADVLMTAPRLLKTAEQMGFVPVAYLPAFYNNGGTHADVVKMVKLNTTYSPETCPVSRATQAVVTVVDQYFQDQKSGVAIVALLGGLSLFAGLGDGELRKIARLFTQRLFRPGEKVFSKGDGGDEAYVVLRGQVEIHLEDRTQPIATITTGQIFGELAFLDGSPRVANAVASQASILLCLHRTSFNELVQREPHLGMVVLRNIALELSQRLRRTNAAVTIARK